MFGKLALGMLSPAGPRSRLSVLLFHRVLAQHDPLQPGEPTAQEFEAMMIWAKEHFNVLPLAEAVARLKEGALPPRPLAITFDDGYADNWQIACPVLGRLGLHATFFVATGYLDGGTMFNDLVIEAIRRADSSQVDLSRLGFGLYDVGSPESKRRAIQELLDAIKYLPPRSRADKALAIGEAIGASVPSDLMMRSKDIERLHQAGMGIGAHTVTHPILAQIPPDEAREEMNSSKARLEELIGTPVTLFAYPNGRPKRDYTQEHVRLARDLRFSAAVSTCRGTASAESDPFQIPRFTPWDRPLWKWTPRLAHNLLRAQEVAS